MGGLWSGIIIRFQAVILRSAEVRATLPAALPLRSAGVSTTLPTGIIPLWQEEGILQV